MSAEHDAAVEICGPLTNIDISLDMLLELLSELLPGRRERIATAALAGLLAAPDTGDWEPNEITESAVGHADELIAELDRTAEETDKIAKDHLPTGKPMQ